MQKGSAEELQKKGEDLKRLINVRGAYRGYCTRAIKVANEIMESDLPNLDALEDVFEGLCSRMERLSLQNQKIDLAVPEDKIEEEIAQTLEYTGVDKTWAQAYGLAHGLPYGPPS